MEELAMTQTDTLQLFNQAWDAFNRKDWKTFRQMMSPDIEFLDMTGMKGRGLDAYMELIQVYVRAFPDMKGVIHKTVVSGDSIAAELSLEGTHTGDLVGPQGTIPPTGKKIALPHAQMVTFEGGKGKSDHHYGDSVILLAQLGVQAPAAAASR
jgi:predicted ester cyclase